MASTDSAFYDKHLPSEEQILKDQQEVELWLNKPGNVPKRGLCINVSTMLDFSSRGVVKKLTRGQY